MSCTQSLFPNAIEFRGTAKLTVVTCPLPRAPRRAPGQGKNVMIVPGVPDVIAKIKMIAPGSSKFNSPLDQTQPERLGVKVEIALRISRNRGDVVDAGAAHGKLEGERVAWPANLAMSF